MKYNSKDNLKYYREIKPKNNKLRHIAGEKLNNPALIEVNNISDADFIVGENFIGNIPTRQEIECKLKH